MSARSASAAATRQKLEYGAGFVVLDGLAHLAGLENPSLVNTLIEDFVFGR